MVKNESPSSGQRGYASPSRRRKRSSGSSITRATPLDEVECRTSLAPAGPPTTSPACVTRVARSGASARTTNTIVPSGIRAATEATPASGTIPTSNRPSGSRARGTPGIARPAARTAPQEARVYSFAATVGAPPSSAGVASAIQPFATFAGIHCDSTSWLRPAYSASPE